MVSRRVVVVGLAAMAVGVKAMASGAKGHSIYLGTDTAGASKGIYRGRWDFRTGKISGLELAAETVSPSFLAMGWGGRFLYAVNEGNTAKDTVTAFAIDRATGGLKELNRVSTRGAGPCYVSVGANGRGVFVANYAAGSISSYAVGRDGRLSEAVSHFVYRGHGPHAKRQEKPHAHAATVVGDWLLVNDLGLDRILVYKIDRATAELTANEPAGWAARAGSGPRHVAAHPNGRWVYCVNELDSTVDLLAWDRSAGTLTTLATVPTLAEDFDVSVARASAVILDEAGRFLYVGNRGHDSVAVFKIAKDGRLTLVQRAPCGGKNPRALQIDPSGRWVVVENQDSGNVVMLRRNARTGMLGEPVNELRLDAPMHAVFA